MRNLQKISIAFTTQSTTFALAEARVHVFVKNRRSDTSIGEPDTDFVSNLLAWQAAEAAPPAGVNPYLGCALGLDVAQFGAPETPIDVPLRTQPILAGEVILPVVDVHLYTGGVGRWAFNYTITFQFDDGSFSYSPAEVGIPSILLDNNAPDHSGICREANPWPVPARPASEPVYLASVTLDFGTHTDDKAADTRLAVHIVNRVSATSSQDIVVAEGLFDDQGFPLPASRGMFTHLMDFPGDRTVVFGQGSILPLASQQIQLQELVLPVVYITVAPTGGDRWIFDYRVTYAFSNGMRFSSTTGNVSLDRDSHTHQGVYNGPPLPTYAPPPPTGDFWPQTVATRDKEISLSFVQAKLDELVNHRPDPLFRFRLDNAGSFGLAVRESYYDLQSIMPAPPPPGTLSVPGYTEPVAYRSGPASLGFLDSDVYFDKVESESLKLTIDAGSLLPVTALLTFKTPFDLSYTGLSSTAMTVTEFWIRLRFTLALDPDGHKVDLLRWVHDLNRLTWTPAGNDWSYSGEFLGQPVAGTTSAPWDLIDSFLVKALVVHLKTVDGTDPGGTFQKIMRSRIFAMLSTPAPITEKSPADRINDYVNAWLLGGVVSGENRCTVSDVHPDGDTLHVVYTGPTYDPPPPAGWPAGVDFSPGALAEIDHIVVLTKENRSFDSMLGYLSLPAGAGGRGRTDVDGLKGDERNLLDGTPCPSFPFEPQDTIFSPNPPQDPQRTLREIDNGAMDGFVAAFADQDGAQVAPRIMGYHTAANVPVFDALARDFAICQRWFAPHPGPTFPNRFYQLTGRLHRTPDGYECADNTTSLPDLDYASPVMPALVRTIFDELPPTVSWKYFENGGYCFLRMLADHTFDATNIARFDDPEAGFLALARRGELPNVSFIDPHFIDIPPGATCDEPPADVRPGQDLVRQVVEAVVAGPQWDKTLLIITYDEHGGFFDHVPPAPAAKVTAESAETYGVRVPTFFISPWVRPGTVVGHDGVSPRPPRPPVATGSGAGRVATGPLQPLHFDHTSILKTIASRFIGAAPPYLGARYAAARSLAPILAPQPRRGPFRPFIPYTLVYAKTQTGLEAPSAAGAPVRQDVPNAAAEAQQFRLEDAGDGHWLLRAHPGDLYLTADPALTVTLRPRYAAGNGAVGPDAQRWTLTPGPLTPTAGDFTIANAAYPAKVLQPQNGSAVAGALTVLGDPEPALVATHVRNAWHVTSPLLPAARHRPVAHA